MTADQQQKPPYRTVGGDGRRTTPTPEVVTPPKGDGQTCDRCTAYAPFSIADYNDDLEPITTWFACGRHVAQVLREEDWNLDAVEVRYTTAEEARDAL